MKKILYIKNENNSFDDIKIKLSEIGVSDEIINNITETSVTFDVLTDLEAEGMLTNKDNIIISGCDLSVDGISHCIGYLISFAEQKLCDRIFIDCSGSLVRALERYIKITYPSEGYRLVRTAVNKNYLITLEDGIAYKLKITLDGISKLEYKVAELL